MAYEHVVDERLRKILNDELTDEDSVCYALTVTAEALREDMANEDIDLTVLDARLSAYNDAHGWWNDESDGFKAVESLQQVWG